MGRRGLLLTTPGTFNVGCSSALRGHLSGGCLGADDVFNDFGGIMNGSFVVPGGLQPASVSRIAFEFCFCTSDSALSLFGEDGDLLQSLQGDFRSQTITFDTARIASFSIDFGNTFGSALYAIDFDGIHAIPEPGSLALFALAVVILMHYSMRSPMSRRA